MASRVYVVFNPHSGKGRGARLVDPVLRALRRDGTELAHGITREPGEETRLAAAALADGFDTIVAVGGDGTWSNVGGAVLAHGDGARLGLVAGGTGCDLAKSLGIPAGDVDECARIVHGGRVQHIDVGEIEDKHFLNVLGFGFDIAVIEDSWKVRWLKGDLLYLYCAVRQLCFFPGFPVEIEAAGLSGRHELLMLVVANARVFGGGFRIAPSASLDDGRLDVAAFHNMGSLKRFSLMARLLRGTHESAPEVSVTTADTLRLRFADPPRYETDGEWNQAGSAQLQVTLRPRALPVLVPAGPA